MGVFTSTNLFRYDGAMDTEMQRAERVAKGVHAALEGMGLMSWPQQCTVATLLGVPLLRVGVPELDWYVCLGYADDHAHCWAEGWHRGGFAMVVDLTAEQFGLSGPLVAWHRRPLVYEDVLWMTRSGEDLCRGLLSPVVRDGLGVDPGPTGLRPTMLRLMGYRAS